LAFVVRIEERKNIRQVSFTSAADGRGIAMVGGAKSRRTNQWSSSQ